VPGVGAHRAVKNERRPLCRERRNRPVRGFGNVFGKPV